MSTPITEQEVSILRLLSKGPLSGSDWGSAIITRLRGKKLIRHRSFSHDYLITTTGRQFLASIAGEV